MSKNAYSLIVEQSERKYGKGTALSKVNAGKKFAKMIKENKDKINFSIRAIYEGVVDPDGDIARTNDPRAISEAIGHSAMPYITDAFFTDITLGVYESYKGTNEMALVTEGVGNKTDFEEIPGFGAHEGLEQRQPKMPYSESEFGDKKVGIFYSDFGRIVSLTWEVIFNDQTGQIINKVNDLAEKAMQTVGKGIIQTLEMGTARSIFGEAANKGFYYNGSKILASLFYSESTHSTIDSQTNVNKVSGAGSVAWDDLESAYKLFNKMTDDRGEYIKMLPTTLVIHPDRAIETYKMLGSTALALNLGDSSGNGEAASAIPNFFRNRFKTVIESPYLATATTWFMGDPKKQLQLNWVEKPTTASQGADSESAFTRKIVYRFKVNTHFGVTNTDYRNVVEVTS